MMSNRDSKHGRSSAPNTLLVRRGDNSKHVLQTKSNAGSPVTWSAPRVLPAHRHRCQVPALHRKQIPVALFSVYRITHLIIYRSFGNISS